MVRYRPPYPLVYRKRTNVRSFCPLRIGLRCQLLKNLFKLRFAKTKRFSDMSAPRDVLLVLFLTKNDFWAGVSQKCFWGVWDYSGPILDHFGSILDQNRQNNNYIKKNIKHPIKNPIPIWGPMLGLL